jgi:hypothetical protein
MKDTMVIENGDHLDDRIRAFIPYKLNKDNTLIFTGLGLDKYREEDDEELVLPQIIKAIKSNNIKRIAFESFLNDQSQNKQFIDLLSSCPSLESVYIISHGTLENRFLNEIDESDREKAIKLVQKIKVYDVYYTTYKIPSNGRMFKTFEYRFDIIPMFYNKKHDLIVRERMARVIPIYNFTKEGGDY